MLDGYTGNRHLSAEDVERAIDIICVDDRLGGSRSFDIQTAPDIEITGGTLVFFYPRRS